MKKILLFKMVPLFMLLSSMVLAQERIITGKVTSKDDGSGLPGVNVIVKGTTNGTVSDSNGGYSIATPSSGGTLIFSFIGYKTTEIENNTVVDLTMTDDATLLSEVVVVGYGEQSSRNKIQSVSTVSAEAFRNMPAIGPQALLQGQAAGVQVVGSSGLLGGSPAVRIRGAASISGGGSPLYVVDGVPLNDGANGNFSNQQGGGAPLNPLIDLNQNDIESMSVLNLG